MTSPVALVLADTVALLKEWGYPVTTRDGWETREARADIPFAPVAVVNHHTASWETSDRMLFVTGNGHVPGPLCHFTIYRDGTIVLGAAGYANHAGINNKAAVELLTLGLPLQMEYAPGADTAGYSGNRRTIGVEVKCPGAYNADQRKAAVALNAALVTVFGWSQTRPPVGAHKEITRRKPGDPGDDMASFRRDVVAFLAEKSGATPPPEPVPAPTPAIAYPTLRMGSIGKWVRALQLKLGGRADGVFGPLTRGRVKAAQKRLGLTVDGIAGPKTLKALGVTL